MLAESDMPTSINSRTTINSRDPMQNLAQEMRLRNFSRKTISAYLYYNKELLRLQVRQLTPDALNTPMAV